MQSIDLNGLQRFRGAISEALAVPQEAFSDLENTFLCFDFDGSGLLEVNEVYKLVKHQLREYRKQLGGDGAITGFLPFRNLQQSGYRVVKELGRGAQGVVHLAQDGTGREYCLKAMKRSEMSASGVEQMQEEFQTIQLLAHDAIANVFEVFQDSQFYFMVGEAYSGGDFMTLTERATEQGVAMTEGWWKLVFRQCCEGVEFMHDQSLMHCDIKEPNIMLKTLNMRNPEVVFIDFGVCKAMVTAPNGMPAGTPGYMPPETIQLRRWFPRGDIFCLGVTLIQVLLGKSPPQGPRTTTTPGGIFVEGCQTIRDIFNATVQREPPFTSIPASVPQLCELLRAMLSKSVAKRPTASNVLGFEWFQGGHLTERRQLKARNDWATLGITKSFLARPSLREQMSPAARAIVDLQRRHGLE